MSCVRTLQSTMTDQGILTDALKKLNYNPVVSEAGEKIRGDRTERSVDACQVILKREDTKRKADIGFSKTKDGTFKLVTDSYVNNDLNVEQFVDQVTQQYSEIFLRRTARSKGFEVQTSSTKNGKRYLTFAKTAA